MYITKVINYRNAWENLNSNHHPELEDIVRCLPEFVYRYQQEKAVKGFRPFFRDIWNTILVSNGWERYDRRIITNGQRTYLPHIGPVKNKVSASLLSPTIEFINRWLFQQTTLAAKYQISEIPILLVPTDEYAKILDDRTFTRASWEVCLNHIQPLTPLSHPYPFLILGFSEKFDLLDPEIVSLDFDPLTETGDIVIDRSIEFPPQYYQAGLNILNYFGSYLREQYPDENAKVKIEQDGDLVRLTIETTNGRKEIIEKALAEYQLIVTGEKKPNEVTNNQKLILELNSELRIAKYRIETQQDILNVQQSQIDKLMHMVALGLSNKSSVNIDFKPTIRISNNTTINNDISDALTGINELKDLLTVTSNEYAELKDLEGSLASIEDETDPEVVQTSSAMKKWRKFIESVTEGNSQLAKTINAAESGWETFKDLAGKYNKIAEWCGLPQVPSIFTK